MGSPASDPHHRSAPRISCCYVFPQLSLHLSPVTRITSTPQSRIAPEPTFSFSKSTIPAPALAPTASPREQSIAIGFRYRQRPAQNHLHRRGRKQVQIAGPTLVERQQGQLKIVLLPAGKAQFMPASSPPDLTLLTRGTPIIHLNANRRSPFPATPPASPLLSCFLFPVP